MPSEVDRLLFWKSRVERLEAELHETHPAMHGLIRARLESAKRSEHAAFAVLISTAHSGDPEAIVALDALESESRVGQNALSGVTVQPACERDLRRGYPVSTKWGRAQPSIPPFN